MKKVYECDITKRKELMAILEADPYSSDSFARTGYKLQEGTFVGHDKAKLYLYISASDELLKKAEEKLKALVQRCKPEVEADIVKKITDEEETAQSGFGAIFG